MPELVSAVVPMEEDDAVTVYRTGETVPIMIGFRVSVGASILDLTSADDGVLGVESGLLVNRPYVPSAVAINRDWINGPSGFVQADFTTSWTIRLGEAPEVDMGLGFNGSGLLIQRTAAENWDWSFAGIAAREVVQTAPFSSNTITLDTSSFSRFAHTTNLAANVAVHTNSWNGLGDAARMAELRVQTGTTGYTLTVPSGTIFYNKPTAVLTPSRVHRFLLGKDGSTRTIYYVGVGETI